MTNVFAVKLSPPGFATIEAIEMAAQCSAEYAREQAESSLSILQELSSNFSSGANLSRSAYEKVSCAAHMASFAVMTYGQICLPIKVLPEDICQQLIAAGKSIQARALSHEELFLSEQLSPAAVFYDDLMSRLDLKHSHHAATLTAPSSSISAHDLAHEKPVMQPSF